MSHNTGQEDGTDAQYTGHPNETTETFAYRKDEGMIRRYPAECSEHGPGIFYITTQRLIFHSYKHGIQLNLDYEHLFDWRILDDSLSIRWQELKPGQSQHRLKDDIFGTIFQFKRGAEWMVHMILYVTYTSRFPVGSSGLGWYLNERGELLHRYNVKPQVYDGKLPLCLQHLRTNTNMNEILSSQAKKNAPTGKESKIEDGGQFIFEQCMYEWLTRHTAQEIDWTWSCHDGYIYPGALEDNGKHIVLDIIKDEIEHDISDGISAYQKLLNVSAEGDRVESRLYMPRILLCGMVICEADSLEGRLKYLKEKQSVMPQVYELIKDESFESIRQASMFSDELQLRITEEMRGGMDITKFVQHVQKRPGMVLSDGMTVRDKIKKYRCNLRESGVDTSSYQNLGLDPNVEKHQDAYEYWLSELPGVTTYAIPRSRMDMEVAIDLACSKVEENITSEGVDLLARDGIIKNGWDHSKSPLFNRINVRSRLAHMIFNPNQPVLMEHIDRIVEVMGKLWYIAHMAGITPKDMDESVEYMRVNFGKMDDLRLSDS